MGEQKSAIKLKGKIGDLTFTTGKQGDKVRSSATLTEKQKKETGLRKQNIRTGIINKIASPLKKALQHYNDGYMPGIFWSDMLKIMRKEETDHRVLLLQKIRGMEVDKVRKFSDSCPQLPIEINVTAKQYSVEADLSNPATARREYNTYYLQFIMIVFDGDGNECRYSDESTPWIDTKDRSPKFATFKFSRKTSDSEYVLACRLVLGTNSIETGYVTDTRMCVLTTGTVAVASKKIVEQRKKEIEAARNKKVVKPAVKERKVVEIRSKK